MRLLMYAIAAVLNILDGGHSYPEDRPMLAEPCWYEDNSAFWVEIAGPDSYVCDGSGYKWIYVEVDNGD